ncbi:MAG: hypothetical protein IKS28_01160, partial [Clostridia bacterium]|nr:hypothetical protein [Clostridia bacterium]
MNRNTRPPESSDGARRVNNSADYARRRAAYARAQEQKAEAARQRAREKERRRENRRRAGRVFLGRLLVGVLIFLVLAAVAAVAFWIHFQHTSAPQEPVSVRYSFCGTDGGTLEEASAYRGGVLCLDFARLAAALRMTNVGDGEEMRFVVRPDASGGTTDSAGTGRDEDVVFRDGSDVAEVNGQAVRLAVPALFGEDSCLIPAAFVTRYMCGVTLTQKGNTVTVERTDADTLFLLQRADALSPIPEGDYSGLGGETGQTDPPTPVTDPPATMDPNEPRIVGVSSKGYQIVEDHGLT